MGSSDQAEIDVVCQSGAAANVCCRKRVVVRAGAAWRCQRNADIGTVNIEMEIDNQGIRPNSVASSDELEALLPPLGQLGL